VAYFLFWATLYRSGHAGPPVGLFRSSFLLSYFLKMVDIDWLMSSTSWIQNVTQPGLRGQSVLCRCTSYLESSPYRIRLRIGLYFVG